MKNFCITFLALFIIIATVLFCTLSTKQPTQTEYLRIHVRANSNQEVDQAVKYRVKDAVVAYLTPLCAQCNTKAEAMQAMQAQLSQIADVCEQTLATNGFFYGARAEIRQEDFPTRVYGEVTLESGVYDALIIELGEGTGDNWWCVLYPPLCFTAGDNNVQYRSAIYDIIQKFFNK